jgi:hypothetical protein
MSARICGFTSLNGTLETRRLTTEMSALGGKTEIPSQGRHDRFSYADIIVLKALFVKSRYRDGA